MKPEPVKKSKAARRRSSPNPPPPTSSAPNAPTRVLVPLDFSAPSKQALRTAATFARRYGARLTLLTVIEPHPFAGFEASPLAVSPKELEARLMTELAALGGKEVDEPDLEGVLVRTGKPFEEIVDAARVLKTDLIIIATRGYTGVKHLLLGSTTERVIRYAPCPVLTVQAEQKQTWPSATIQSA